MRHRFNRPRAGPPILQKVPLPGNYFTPCRARARRRSRYLL